MTMVRVKALHPQTLAHAADWLAVGVAASLPWSTTATGIFIALWLLAFLFTADAAMLRRELATAAGGLPVALWALAAIGMLWADVSWSERVNGLAGFHKLLVIPLLLAHFRRSDRGIWAVYGFFASVLGLLLLSWTLALFPALPWHGKEFGVPVKDYIMQSTAFLICAFALLGRALDNGRAEILRSLGLAALALFFLANIFFVATGRTALLVIPVLALLLGWREFGWKGLLGAGLLGCIIGVTVGLESPYLHQRLITSVKELRAYRTSDAFNSTALHLEFLRKSLEFVETAPIIGHGTGSIGKEFRNAVVGQTGAEAAASVNPHNQIFAVAIQLGLVGTAVLLAMWMSHLMLFRGGGMMTWIGMLVVVQNMVSSLVNSHLFDFTQGWLYVFGVGVVGGLVLRKRAAAPEAGPEAVLKAGKP
jgi:O-antigen ligase